MKINSVEVRIFLDFVFFNEVYNSWFIFFQRIIFLFSIFTKRWLVFNWWVLCCDISFPKVDYHGKVWSSSNIRIQNMSRLILTVLHYIVDIDDLLRIYWLQVKWFTIGNIWIIFSFRSWLLSSRWNRIYWRNLLWFRHWFLWTSSEKRDQQKKQSDFFHFFSIWYCKILLMRCYNLHIMNLFIKINIKQG